MTIRKKYPERTKHCVWPRIGNTCSLIWLLLYFKLWNFTALQKKWNLLLSAGVQVLILNWDSNGCGNYFFSKITTIITIWSITFLNFYFSWKRECAENAAGEILLCNQALETAVNHKSPLFISLQKGNKAQIYSALNSLPGTHEELHVHYDT